MRSNRLTRFVARYVPGSMADCLCFGEPVHQHDEPNPPSRRTVYHFRPGQLFGILCWRRYPLDYQHRLLAVVEATSAGRGGQLLPGIYPGVKVHTIVDQQGPAGQEGSVDQLLDLIQDLKEHGQNPAELPPSFWTQTGNDVLLHQMPLDAFYAEASTWPG